VLRSASASTPSTATQLVKFARSMGVNMPKQRERGEQQQEQARADLVLALHDVLGGGAGRQAVQPQEPSRSPSTRSCTRRLHLSATETWSGYDIGWMGG
jgi:hypothetical protein